MSGKQSKLAKADNAKKVQQVTFRFKYRDLQLTVNFVNYNYRCHDFVKQLDWREIKRIYHYNDDDDKQIKKVFNDGEEQCDKHIGNAGQQQYWFALVLTGWDNDDEELSVLPTILLLGGIMMMKADLYQQQCF